MSSSRCSAGGTTRRCRCGPRCWTARWWSSMVAAKRHDSSYQPGRRGGSWLKIKHQRTQEVVVGGWRPGNGRREGGVGSLLLAVNAGDGLRYVGRVGTGFNDRQLEEAQTRLAP